MPEKMWAVVKQRPELGASYIEMDVPRLRDDEILVKVKATSICGTDVHIYNWDPWSDSRIGPGRLPQVLGHELAGEIVEVGREVRVLKPGDYVSAETHIPDLQDLQTWVGQMHIGEHMKILGVDMNGCFAEYIAMPAMVAWKNDQSIPYEFASVQEPLGNATYAVLGEDNDVGGRSMVIIGDGPIALFATGVARALGVTSIFVVGMSDFNLELAKQMGADHVLNVFRDTDRVGYVKDHTRGFGADIVLDMAGSAAGIDDGLKMLRKGGRFSAFGIVPDRSVSIDYNASLVFKGAQIVGINGRKMFDTWYRVRNLLSSGRLDISPVITHMFLLEDFEKGFAKLLERPRMAAKVVFFLEQAELEAARQRRGMSADGVRLDVRLPTGEVPRVFHE
ncbi:MAG: zinc-binding dehydrogenase [Myxococcota bacterium]|jgi:threonine 3-dehydrogenase|nr:zinc-binding dehydrogenase [Myxococcota bacterium]